MSFRSRLTRVGLVWQFAIAFSAVMLVAGTFLYTAVRNYAHDTIRASSLALSEEEEYLAVLRRRATQQTAQPRPPGDGSGYRDRLLEGEDEALRADGLHTYLTIKAPLTDASGRVYGLCGISTDITARKRAEGALRRSEEQLRQAQKMEAIGKLAGGIAHDFNNLLSVILGYGSLLVERMEPGDERRADAEEIVRACTRAAALTQQLLAFGRKQLLQPRTIKLSDVVVGVECMLRRLI